MTSSHPQYYFQKNHNEIFRLLPNWDVGLNSILIHNNYITDKLSLVVGEILTGTATSIYNSDRYVSMSLTNNGDKIVRQTLEHYPTISHKIKKCIFSVCLNTLTDATGYRSRVGIFDDSSDSIGTNELTGSGLFFQLENNVFSIGMRNDTVDTIITRDNFNVSTMENDSYFKYNRWDKVQHFEIMYNALDMIEWAIYIDGIRILLHKHIEDANGIKIIPRYSLPIRYEFEKIDDVSNIGEMRQFQESISVENGANGETSGGSGGGGTCTCTVTCDCSSNDNSTSEYPGTLRQLTEISNKKYIINTINTYIPIFSIRLKTAFVNNPIVGYEVNGVSTSKSNNCFQVAIVKNPVFDNIQPIWDDTQHRIQYSTNSNTIDNTSLDIITEFYIVTNQTFPDKNKIGRAISISSDISNIPDIFTVVARKLDMSSIIYSYFSFNWTEE